MNSGKSGKTRQNGDTTIIIAHAAPTELPKAKWLSGRAFRPFNNVFADKM